MAVRRYVEVICDKCQIESDTIGSTALEARLLANRDEGWRCNRHGDLCPRCKRRWGR